MRNYTRRGAMAVLGGGALAACMGTEPAAPGTSGNAATGDFVPLKDLAAHKGLRFGSAISARQLTDPRYLAIVERECDSLVAENEHKIYVILPEPDAWNFRPGDAIRDYAQAQGLGLRGHTLIWHHPRWLPAWINETEFGSAGEAEAFLANYIERVGGRYDPFITSWDVVNETVDPEEGSLRETSFSRAIGPEVIDVCFRQAREHAPNAKLLYNDYMSWEDASATHRDGVLRLLEGLVSRGAPIDGLGIQSHSNEEMPDTFTPAKQRAWRAFCDEVVGMGLDLHLTEFDVNDTMLGPDIEMRDRLIASYTKDYLDMMFAYPQTKELLAWGMVDKDSWLQGFMPREDEVEKRPTLYDSDYQAKPMREAVAAALRAAPAR